MSRAGPYDNGKGNGKGNDKGNGGEGLWNDLIRNDDRRRNFQVQNHETRTYLAKVLEELDTMERNLRQTLLVLQLRIQQQRFALLVLDGN